MINRHQAQLAHINPLDPVLKVGRKGEAIEQDRQIVLAHRDFFAAELDTKKVTGQKLGQFRTAFAIIGHHLDDTCRRLIGHRRLENRPIGTANQLTTIIESEVVVRQTLAVNRDLDQFAVFAIKGRAYTFEDVDVNVVRGEPFAQRRPEGIDRDRIPPHRAIDLADETIPTAAASAFIGEADFLRVLELHALVQEHPERPVIGVRKAIEHSPIINDTVDGHLPGIVRHRPDPVRIVDNAATCRVIHIIHCLKQRSHHIRLGCIPIQRRRQLDPGSIEVGPKRCGGRVADEAGDRRHLDVLLSL